MRFGWIAEHAVEFPVRLMCKLLLVSASGFYAWRGRAPSPRQTRHEQWARQVATTFAASDRIYGSPRVYHAMRKAGVQICENTVATLMRKQRLRSKRVRRFVPATTDSRHDFPVAENLLARDFTATAPDQKWVCDITYVPTDEGWLYVAGTLDLFSRKVVGLSMAEHMRVELVGESLEMALGGRQPKQGLLHHSDRGVQYASDGYRQMLQQNAIVCSMSRTGNCYDNAAMESFWCTLKTELVYHQKFATRQQARQMIFEYVLGFYNRVRLHSSLAYLSPEAFEAQAV
ncbi:MAG: IS3 family transposase [Rhodanobacteraceae bacterium]